MPNDYEGAVSNDFSIWAGTYQTVGKASGNIRLIKNNFLLAPDSATNYKNNTITITIHNSIEEKLITNEFFKFIHYFQQYVF